MKIMVLAGLSIFCMAASPAPTLPDLPNGQAEPVKAPYDPSQDAHKAVADAIAEAQKTHKNVLLDFGANWCPDCRMLAGIFEVPVAKSWVAQNFVPVMIDVGETKTTRFTVNADIAAQYGYDVKQGIPTVLIISPTGKVLNDKHAYDLSNARSDKAQKVVDALAQWTPG